MRSVGGWLAGVAGVFLVPFLLPDFQVALMTNVGLAALVAIGLVLLTGIGGQTSFGQAAFAGIGAYATAVLTQRLGWSPWLTWPFALLLAAAASLLIGLVTVRLSGHFIGLATIAWGSSAALLMGTLPGLGGFNGLPDIAPLPLLSQDPRLLLVFVGALVLSLVWLMRNLLAGRHGRAIRGLAENRAMAESMGVDTARVALWIFVIAAVAAGLSGWLYAHVQRVVNPSPFGLTAGIEYLFMVIIGGAGSLWGAVVGAAVVTVLRDQLSDWLPRLLGRPGNFEGMVFAACVVLALQRMPAGLVPALARLWPGMGPGAVPGPGGVPPDRRPRPRSRPKAAGVVLEVVDVSRWFGGLRANDAVSFTAQAGRITALIGPNGAGKSTLFNLISGLMAPDSGRITLAGVRIDGLAARKVARAGVARTFQHVRLLPLLSVLDNIALGAHRRGRAGMLAAMLRLDLAEERGLLAEAAHQARRVGLEADLLRPAGDLSLGRQRIVEIGRALCLDPVLLLLDEPAAGLRLQEKAALADLLRGLCADGVAVLIVEHDMAFLMDLADEVVVMEFGRVIARGTPAEIQRDPAVIEAYLGAGPA